MRRAIFLLCLLAGPARADNVAADPKYAAVVASLDPYIRHHVEHKKIPALMIALVDDQKIVWSAGYGFADAAKTRPATADTICRVGSISKLFTDLAAMQLVELGKLNLDEPVTKYLPDFKPRDPFNGPPITLRMLMSHRAGLVREPPLGSYFDPAVQDLEKTVTSLNETTLVYQPDSTTKYSNAGLAVVGLIVQKTAGVPFADVVRDKVIKPLGLKNTDFKASDRMKRELADGVMWTLHGKESIAPKWELGMAPAACLYSSASDLARFLSMTIADGRDVVKPETLKVMLTPRQGKAGFGLGFLMSDVAGLPRFGHSGAMYGFATEVAALPDEKLGAVVIASRDCANALSTEIADLALAGLHVAKAGQRVASLGVLEKADANAHQRWLGRYAAAKSSQVVFELERTAEGARYWPLLSGGEVVDMTDSDDFVANSPLDMSRILRRSLLSTTLTMNGLEYVRLPDRKPEPAPERWKGLIGEYGWDHNTLYLLEREGKLYCLIEWFFLYPLTEISADTFKLPPRGMYSDETIKVNRDANGRATQASLNGLVFPRRNLPGEGAPVFKIQPQRPVDQLMREALAAQPPAAKGEFNPPDLVELASVDTTLKFDIRYASSDNFLGVPVYPVGAKAMMQRPAAEALKRVNARLAQSELGLLIHDAYRPWHVTKVFWDATPGQQKVFVADPALGSRHNRGCAVDLTLYDQKTGQAVAMPSLYDEFSDRAYPHYPGGTSLERYYRRVLRDAMEAEGFTVYEAEWWHFDFREWKKYSVLNVPLAVEKKQ